MSRPTVARPSAPARDGRDRLSSPPVGTAPDTRTRHASAALRIGQAAVIGSVCGLAWAGALRAYMAELNSALSTVTWGGTFVGILLPGVLAGAALGAATAIEPTVRGRRALHWCAAAPLAFAVFPMLLPGQLAALLTTGLGGGAVGVALGGLAGGYALGGRRRWARWMTALVWSVIIVGVAATVPPIGGPELAASEARGWWIMLLAASLMILLGLAASIPFRRLSAYRDSHTSQPVET